VNTPLVEAFKRKHRIEVKFSLVLRRSPSAPSPRRQAPGDVVYLVNNVALEQLKARALFELQPKDASFSGVKDPTVFTSSTSPPPCAWS
jgi:hypothetical protein